MILKSLYLYANTRSGVKWHKDERVIEECLAGILRYQSKLDKLLENIEGVVMRVAESRYRYMRARDYLSTEFP